MAGAVSGTTPAIIQSTPALKPTQPSSQAVPVPTLVLLTPDLNSQPTQTPSQITSVEVAPAIPTQTTLAPSGLVPCASVEPTPSIQSAPPASIFAPPFIPASAIPVSALAQVPAPILDAPDQSSTTLPIDGTPHTTVTPIPHPYAPPTSISPPAGPAKAPHPDLPQSSLNEPIPQPCETSAMPDSSKFHPSSVSDMALFEMHLISEKKLVANVDLLVDSADQNSSSSHRTTLVHQM